jgi:hypothetical protein
VDPLILNVVSRYRSRVAGITQINVPWVENMRRDFLTLMKNLPRVRDYDEASELKGAFEVYKDRFKLLFFEHFLNEYKDNGDLRFENLRSPAWNFYLELWLPLTQANSDYPNAGKAERFQRFLDDKSPWEKKVKARAQTFWKVLRDTLENTSEAEIPVKTPNRDRLVIEGFQAEIYGFNPQEDWHQTALSKFKESLRIYRSRAAKTVPWLLQHQLPIEINFESKLDKGGEYIRDHVVVSMLSTTGESPLWGAHVMAHEMGHHMYKGLSGSAQEYWDTAIRQDYGPLDLRELLSKWPTSLTWSTDFTDLMSDKDPVLALQVDVLSHGHESHHAYETREDFQSGFDAGVTSLSVPKNPVTGYAGKKPEEAFCEAIGRLVAYGPATVLDQVKAWLRVVIPGEVKLARELGAPEVTAVRVARLFVAGLADELETKVEDLVKNHPEDRQEALEFLGWLKKNFKTQVAVRGHKELVGELDRLVGILTEYYGQGSNPSFGSVMVQQIWERGIKPRLEELTQYFTDEGGSKLVSEYKLGSNTYLNQVGMAKDSLVKYATRLDSLFGTLTGWRKKALSGGLTVALAPPKNFRGTSSGKYKTLEDILYVRAVPKVLQRSGGSYGSIDYILIHELGHRYEHLHPLKTNFDVPEWWTSKYSMTESMSGSSESFAELFAIGHFGITGPWDQSKVERFEKLMG